MLQLLPGIGPTSAKKLLDQLKGPSGLDRLANLRVPKHTQDQWPNFAKLMRWLRKKERGWPAEFQLVRKWYEPYLVERYENPDLRKADIEQLEGIAAG